MEMNIKKHPVVSTVKSASPETLFARYLQKQSKKPTKAQIEKWEVDGGQGFYNADDFVFIHGRMCRTFSEKVSAYATYYWRVTKMYIKGQQTHN